LLSRKRIIFENLDLYSEMADHPMIKEWFEARRPEIWRFISGDLYEAIQDGKRNILVIAPVKCGKRVMVEASTLVCPEYKHYYVCSLNRKDVKAQKDELSSYEIALYCVTTNNEGESAIQSIQSDITRGEKVIIHFDECDYGSGRNQKMAPLFNKFLEKSNVVKIYYSATPEETLYSNLASRDDYGLLEFTPPESYMGASFFLENDLVFEPDDFFDKDEGRVFLTDHGKQVIRDSITDKRHIIVVRYTPRKISMDLFKSNKEHIEIQAKLHSVNRKPFIVKVIDEKDTFPWEDVTNRNGYVKTQTHNYILIIKQTCTRGTDLYGWHHCIAAWHDSRRADKTNLNTLLQAILRPSHYDVNYCEHGIWDEDCPCKETCNIIAQNIRMYVSRSAMEKAAGGSMEDYLRAGGKQPTRTQKGRNTARYQCNVNDETVSSPYTFESANKYIVEHEGTPFEITQFQQQDGFYIPKHAIGIGQSKIVGRPVSYEEAYSRRNLQYSRTGFWLIPCYRNLSDPDSVVWIANKKLTPQGPDAPLTTSRSSMFH
jgi:hypothetical protein